MLTEQQTNYFGSLASEVLKLSFLCWQKTTLESQTEGGFMSIKCSFSLCLKHNFFLQPIEGEHQLFQSPTASISQTIRDSVPMACNQY